MCKMKKTMLVGFMAGWMLWGGDRGRQQSEDRVLLTNMWWHVAGI